MPMPKCRCRPSCPMPKILRTVLICVLLGAPVHALDLPKHYVHGATGQFTQGGLVVLALTEGTQVTLNGEALAVVNGHTLIGFGRDATLNQSLHFNRQGKSTTVPIKLEKRSYDIQRIDGLPPAMVNPPEEALPRIIRGGKLKRAARAMNSRRADFTEDFIWPVKGRISGVYGSQRFYNGEPRRPHFGIDIAAPRGTKVIAPAPGKVTLAEPDMYFEGGLIFIDHGLKLTSAYMHLDSLKVKPGDEVKAGDVIATVGSTGRSTGPHLDWRMFWRGERIDPALVVSSAVEPLQ